MKHNQMNRVFLMLSIGGFAMTAISWLLMPIDALQVLPGVLFWGGLLLGVVFQMVLEVRRRAFFARYKVNRARMQKPRNGLLTFGSNKAAIITDKIFVVSFVATILVMILTKGVSYLCYIGISMVFMSFCLHCILNGRNYFHVNNQDRVRQVLEQQFR